MCARTQLMAVSTPACDCGESQSGDHITFHCPNLQDVRTSLLGPTASTWEHLDAARYHPDEEDEDVKTDLVEEFFGHVFSLFNP